MTLHDRVRWVLRGVGQTLITAGLVVLLFCVYELTFTGLYAEEQQQALDKQLGQGWAAPTTSRPAGKPQLSAYQEGKGIARLYLPTLGTDEVHVVIEGVSKEDLKKGPGHYPGTAAPGEVGNVVISGHRTTYGAPFNALDELEEGDAIVLETKSFFYTYRVMGTTIVKPSAIGEVAPVPNQPGKVPTQRLLTLTTCHPKFSARSRLVVRALLETPLAKRPGIIPPALGG